jgi:thiamine monophosphate kinase
MDNTDGFGQTVFELSQLNGVGFLLNASALPIHPISRQVAAFLGVDVIDLALGPGADFQLVGTIAADALPEGADTSPGIRCVGRATSAAETIAVLDATGRERAVTVTGWDYFSNDPVGSVRASS